MKNLFKKKILILSLLLLALCGFMYKQNLSNKKEYIIKDDPQIFSRIDNRKPGIYFFYFPECPWCEEILPILKEESDLKKKNIWMSNIHDKEFTSNDRDSLLKLYRQTNNGNEIMVPFIITINKSRHMTAQIGLISPNIKYNRKTLIRKEVVSTINRSDN